MSLQKPKGKIITRKSLVEAAALFGAGRLLGTLFLEKGVPLVSPREESR